MISTPQKAEPGALVSGGKILSGGDVNLKHVTNVNIVNKIDDSNRVMTCKVSGKQAVITEGSVCTKCNQWVINEFIEIGTCRT